MNLANDYRALRPNSDEDRMSYALRLQKDGFEEMFIRKALRCHFQMKIEHFPVFFEGFEQARLGHIGLLLQIRSKPKRLFPCSEDQQEFGHNFCACRSAGDTVQNTSRQLSRMTTKGSN